MEWYMFLFASAIFMAFADLLTKHTLHRVHAMELIGMRGSMNLILILLLIPFIDLNIPPLAWALSILTGVLLTFGMLYRAKAIRHLEISVTAPLMNFSPVFLLIIAAAFLKEYPTPMQVAGIFLIVGGAYALQVKSTKDIFGPFKEFLNSKYIQYIFFAIFTFAVTATIDRYVLTSFTPSVGPLTYLFIAWGVASFCALALDLYKYGPKDIIYDWQHRKLQFGLISICIFFSAIFFVNGISHPAALIAVAIPIKRFSTLIVTIVGGNLFHEDHIWRKIMGCLIMIAGGVLVVLS